MRYLQRQGELEERGPLRKREAWTRLSFTLTLRNPYFVNFTDVPNAMNPRRDNSYFTNQEAHRKPEIILNPETHVTWQDPLTVVSPEYRVPVSSQVREVRVLAISGEVVLCKPRCVPATVFERKNPADVDCSDASDDGPQVCT
ncbi:MAG: hypothetical protein GY835_23675, partial [bacterium]|nr:hypothetical protein [bacterium]